MNGFAALVLVIPLSSAVNWEVLAFRGIQPHNVRFETDGLRIDVDRSAGPSVHRLTEVRQVRGIRAEGRVAGWLRTTAARQGQEGEDDYVLRVGLVGVGSRRPNWRAASPLSWTSTRPSRRLPSGSARMETTPSHVSR